MHARAHTCCMAWRQHLLTCSENFVLRAIEAALEAPASMNACMLGILGGRGSESRHFGDFDFQRHVWHLVLKALIHILFNT